MSGCIALQVGKWIIKGDEDDDGYLRVWIKHEDESVVVNVASPTGKPRTMPWGEWTAGFKTAQQEATERLEEVARLMEEEDA